MTRKLIEQMLDCIDELKYSNDTFTSQFKSNAAITAATEYLAQPEPLTDEEIIKLADYHTTYQIESPSTSGMVEFARAVLAAQRSKE